MIRKSTYSVIYTFPDPLDGHGTFVVKAKSPKAAKKKFIRHCRSKGVFMEGVHFSVFLGIALAYGRYEK
jgi:hypothetical protein